MHFLGDVGRGEVDDDSLLLRDGGRSHPVGQDGLNLLGDEAFAEVDVDEPWTCHLHLHHSSVAVISSRPFINSISISCVCVCVLVYYYTFDNYVCCCTMLLISVMVCLCFIAFYFHVSGVS